MTGRDDADQGTQRSRPGARWAWHYPNMDDSTQPSSSARSALLRPFERQMLGAVLAIADGLDLPSTLDRIVQTARDLTGAEYAALGVLGSDRRHTTFVQIGVDDETAARIGHPPVGAGVLGFITLVGHSVRTDDVTTHPAAKGFPHGHPPMHSFLGVPVGLGDRVIGNLYLAEKPGGFSEDDEVLVNALAAVAAVAIENAELYRDVERRARWMAAAQQVSTAMLSGMDEEDALHLIAEQAARVADADGAALVLPGLGEDWVLEIAVGDPKLTALIGTVMPQDGRTHAVIRTGIGRRVAQMSRATPMRVPGMKAFGPALYAPLVSKDGIAGVLVLVRRIGRPEFSDADLGTSQTFAEQAAIGLRLAEGRRREEEADLLQDRARIARDLHDLVVQELFAMGMRLNRLGPHLDDEALTEVDTSLATLDRVVRQIRSTIRDLRDPVEPSGLVDRVYLEVTRAQSFLGFAAQVDLDVDRDRDPDDVVPDDVKDDVIAVVREGLANAARHARAASVTVRLSIRDAVVVHVVDDGPGMPPIVARRSGLDNLCERARRHGGTFSIGPAEGGRGTRLRWRVPLQG